MAHWSGILKFLNPFPFSVWWAMKHNTLKIGVLKMPRPCLYLIQKAAFCSLVHPLKTVFPTCCRSLNSYSPEPVRVYHPLPGEMKEYGTNKEYLKNPLPIFLRRNKKEVAPELPEKIEQILHVGLTEEQEEFYSKIRRSAEMDLDKLADSGASEGAMRMKTLTQLLRLRQTCCDPRLIDEEFPADQSAKLNAFRELLYTCLEGGHRMLVFSQFVKVLQLLKAELETAGLNFCYLDGSSKDRMAQVDRFQEDDSIPVFFNILKSRGNRIKFNRC